MGQFSSIMAAVALSLVWLLSLPAASAGATNRPSATLLIADRVFTGEDSGTHEGWAVLVTSNRIAAVGPVDQLRTPEGTTRIELSGTTVLPGLMDIHSHIFLHPYDETLWDEIGRAPCRER